MYWTISVITKIFILIIICFNYIKNKKQEEIYTISYNLKQYDQRKKLNLDYTNLKKNLEKSICINIGTILIGTIPFIVLTMWNNNIFKGIAEILVFLFFAVVIRFTDVVQHENFKNKGNISREFLIKILEKLNKRVYYSPNTITVYKDWLEQTIVYNLILEEEGYKKVGVTEKNIYFPEFLSEIDYSSKVLRNLLENNIIPENDKRTKIKNLLEV